MGKLIILIGVSLIIVGTLITLKVPMGWIGHLPGDISMKWKGMQIYVPFTTSIIFSLVLSVILFIFSKR